MIFRAIRAFARCRPVAVGVVIAVLAASASVAALVLPAILVPGDHALPSPLPGVASTALPLVVLDDPESTILTTDAPPTASRTTGSPSSRPAHRPEVSPGQATFSLDLYRRGDFVSQARADWCVPAAIQMMARLANGPENRSLPSQAALDRRSRALSSSRLVGLGSEPQGWAGVLNRLGYGPYVVVAKRSFADAVIAAADAIRLTGRPVGLLVWRGAHAWVMSGFDASVDPAPSGNLEITAVRVIDPWYPRRAPAWGGSRPPDALVGLPALARSFLRWHRPTVRYAELDSRYVLILPMPATGDRSRLP